MPRLPAFLSLAAALLLTPLTAAAQDVHVAVAANFTPVLKELGQAFERQTGDRLIVSTGSTGKLYAQIANGAPYDVLLAADDTHPRKLEQAGLAEQGGTFVYAYGRLVLWSARPNYVDADGNILKSGRYTRLAIANPNTAPYGAAALAVLKHLGVYDQARPRLVQGEDIGQTFQFAASGNADLGFVAFSQVRARPTNPGSYWLVPTDLYPRIAQGAVLLTRGASNEAARAFIAYLKSPAARAVIERFGYGAGG